MNNQHFLLISLPAQGHINPTLQLAKNLTRAGARATFATTVAGLSSLTARPTLNGLFFASFSDGTEETVKDDAADLSAYLTKVKHVGSQSLANLIHNLSSDGKPVTFLLYPYLLPWAAAVARECQVSSALLAIQSATCFAIYHRFFNGHDALFDGEKDTNPSISIKLPGLSLLTSNDLPSFLLPTDKYYSSLIPTFREHIQTLEKDPHPCVLVNSFDALEAASITAVDNMDVISIGPLVPSAFSDGNDCSDRSFGCDLFRSSGDYVQWMDSKPEGSVIYVSFGSFVALEKRQREEILKGLVEGDRPFLWVNRDGEGEEKKGCGEDGLIVPWCSQMEVLCHRSVGCFVTHCGWNSTLESLVAGVPVVGCPRMSDQMTNAKLLEEVWGTGLRAAVNEEGMVEKEEIKRCLDTLMGGGERGKEIRQNAIKWKGLAMEAVKEGGSSHNNLKQFLKRLG
ncbi:unnamed protein product [Ilex paraguariensis]|uniref:Glycosyltransferase n=1 Tax=Ilex paraguariensis TaxID=185542 RepID=A0ABC8SJL0_9AQUA